MLKKMLQMSLELNASDIILTSGAKPCLKVSGEIQFIDEYDIISKKTMQEIAFSTMNEKQKDKFIEQKELDYGISLWVHRFRINAFMTKNWIWIVCRSIKNDAPEFDNLGLPSIIKKFTDKKNWIVLITGSVDSGKSTSMISLVNEINKNSSKHIITIEDPIEFIFDNKKSLIEQREVWNSTLSFENWLKYALRQAPDIIMLWEMRDLETFKLALRAAETGNLVFATVHTAGAARTISRIIDMFPAWEKDQVRTQLSESLIWVVWQKLLKDKEWKGRVLASEVMINNVSIWNIIRKWDIHQINWVIETSSKEWMVDMKDTLLELYEGWKISEEVYDYEIKLLKKEV
jgi:twitching motility protein PilT